MAEHILEELGSAPPGSDLVVKRLGDILFIRAVRSYFEDNGSADSGWLAALRDPQIGQALALLHEQAAAAGYDSVAGFNKVLKRHMSVTPGEYRRGPKHSSAGMEPRNSRSS